MGSMALDIIQVEGCYVSSSLPKALYVPSPSHSRSTRDQCSDVPLLHFKPKTRSLKLKPPRYSKNEAPVEGRQHLAVQTDLYLEELCDVVETADAQCEADFPDRPPSPVFVPIKTGIDAETQIYPRDLPDSDKEDEVQPTLEDLGEQTLVEASTEEKSKSVDNLQDYEVRLNIAAEELKRIAQEQNHSMQEETIIKETEESDPLEDEVSQKIVARLLSENYLSDLVPQVYKKLEVEGYFEDEEHDMQDTEETFWPWLMDEVDSEIATLEASCQLLDTVIVDPAQDVSETPETDFPSDVKQEEEDSISNKIKLEIADEDADGTNSE